MLYAQNNAPLVDDNLLRLYDLLFALNSPHTLNGSDTFNWLAGDAALAIATGIALFALWRGMQARRARAA